MPEQILHFMKGDILGEHDCRRRMSKLMKVPVSESCRLAVVAEPFGEIRWIDHGPDRCGEDPVVFCPPPSSELLCCLLRTVALEDDDARIREADGPPGISSLRFADDQLRPSTHRVGAIRQRSVLHPLERTTDPDGSVSEVQVRPFERQNLAPPEAQREGEYVEGLVPVTLHLIEKSPGLISVEPAGGLTRYLHGLAEPDYVSCDHAGPLSIMQSLAQDGPDDPQGVR